VLLENGYASKNPQDFQINGWVSKPKKRGPGKRRNTGLYDPVEGPREKNLKKKNAPVRGRKNSLGTKKEREMEGLNDTAAHKRGGR